MVAIYKLRFRSIYTSPSQLDLIIYNARKNFISKEFKQYAIIIGVNIKGVLVEAYNLISIVKRYYSPIRCAY